MSLVQRKGHAPHNPPTKQDGLANLHAINPIPGSQSSGSPEEQGRDDMKKEILKKWEPTTGIPEKLYLVNLTDDERGLRLKFVGESDYPELNIIFNHVLSFRNTDEGDRLKFLNESSGASNWSLYIIENSRFHAWFDRQSYFIHESDIILHYLFYTPDDILDVLSYEEPEVSLS